MGPVSELQLIPDTPVIDQVAEPVGVAPPVGPATEAVKVKVEPSRAVAELVVTVTVGVTFEMIIPYGELGPTVK